MSVQVDRAATFRVKLLEHGITKTKEKGYPQFVAKVAMTQVYDEKEKEWFDVTEWDMETVVYSCLYGVKKGDSSPSPTLGYDQVMKVFEWDGQSLAELAQGNYEGKEFQVRTEVNSYEGAKYPFQVSWIDVYDADPVYKLTKLNADEIKALDAEFSKITASAKKAASAKKVSKPSPAKAPANDTVKKPAPEPTKPLSKEEKQAKLKEKSERIKQEAAKQAQAAKAKAAAPPLPDEEDAKDDTAEPITKQEESITKQEAWARIFEMRDESIDDDTVKELWDAAIEEVTGGGVAHKDVTGEQWWQVKEIVLADCGKF